MGPRIFTVAEANLLVPQVEAVFNDLDRIREDLRRVKGKLDLLEMIWGEEIGAETNPDRREHEHYVRDLERLKKEFEQAGDRFSTLEVSCKGIEAGLVDFYGVIESHLVFLCWKRGEASVEWYHGVDEGFAGRRPIPARELAE